MPEISGVITEGKTLLVAQKDPLRRGLHWEQDLSFLVVYPDGKTEDVQVSFKKEAMFCFKDLKRPAGEGTLSSPMPTEKGTAFSVCLKTTRMLVCPTCFL